MTSPPTPRGRYIPALDGLRGLSLPGTIFTHFGLFLGVLPTAPHWLQNYGPFTLNIEMFFVLSGALITSLLVREHERKGEISMTMFYVRRTRRLLPALICVVPLLLIAQYLIPGSVAGNPLGTSPWLTAGSVLLFLGNWRLVADGVGLGWLGPAWTLGIEEQFYATWPALLYLALRKRVSRVAILLGLAIGTVASVAFSSIALEHLTSTQTFYLTPTQLPPIFVGCALGYELTVNPAGRLAQLVRSRMVALAGLAAMVVISWQMYHRQWALARGGFALYGLAAALLIGHCFVMAGEETFISRFFGWKPFAVIGQVSYEAYLVHCIVIFAVLRVDPSMNVTLMILLDVVLITVLSGVFYYFVERPIRRRGWRRAFVKDTAMSEPPARESRTNVRPLPPESLPAVPVPASELVTSDYGKPLK
jgi:peptidoglycan/LPS O-acetylase OafA/YrhL